MWFNSEQQKLRPTITSRLIFLCTLGWLCPLSSYYKLLRSRNCLMLIRNRVEIAYSSWGCQCYVKQPSHINNRVEIAHSSWGCQCYVKQPSHINDRVEIAYSSWECQCYVKQPSHINNFIVKKKLKKLKANSINLVNLKKLFL